MSAASQPSTRRRRTLVAGAVVTCVAAVGTALADGEVATSFLMLAAVAATLVSFDAALANRSSSFLPWFMLSLAPVVKTSATVLYELRRAGDDGAAGAGAVTPYDLYDRVGTLAFSVFVMFAVLALSRPAAALGAWIATFDAAVTATVALAGGLAGASVAFRYDSDLGSMLQARVLETATWLVIGATLAGVALINAHANRASLSRTAVAGAATASASLAALTVAGVKVAIAWWAAIYVMFACAAASANSDLGKRDDRRRASNAAVVLAIVAGVVTSVCAISARSNDSAWEDGWWILGLTTMGLFALALISRPVSVQAHASFAAAETTEVETTSAASPADGSGDANGTTPGGANLHDDVLSHHDLVSVARAAAEVRNAETMRRHELAPVDQAHLFDPSTGLLSAAGLQHAIASAFDVPRRAGHVTLLLFTVRDLAEIEHQKGRLAAAAITREVAQRVSALFDDGTAARFTRSAYAVIFVADLSNSQHTIERLAKVLVELRAPLDGGAFGDKIDVVASVAQCYDNEDPATFVARANQGLARAVLAPTPTLVAMP